MKNQLVFRWSLLSGALIGLVWAAIYYLGGSMPLVHGLQITGKLVYNFPFVYPRWYDFLLGPIFTFLFSVCYAETKKRLKDGDAYFWGRKAMPRNFRLSIILGFLAGILISGAFLLVLYDVARYINWYFIFISAVALLTGLYSIPLDSELNDGQNVGYGVALSAGLIFGLPMGLAVVLVVAAVFNLFSFLRKVYRRKATQKGLKIVKKWLTAK